MCNKKLIDISDNIITGKTPSTKNKKYYGDDIPFITIPDMHDNVFVTKSLRNLSLSGADSQKNKYIPPFSINVSSIGTPGLVTINSLKSQTNQQINSIVINSKIKSNYLYWLYIHLYFMSPNIKNMGSGGSTILNLNKRNFEKIVVQIPNKKNELDIFNSEVATLFNLMLKNQIMNGKLFKLKTMLISKLLKN